MNSQIVVNRFKEIPRKYFILPIKASNMKNIFYQMLLDPGYIYIYIEQVELKKAKMG